MHKRFLYGWAQMKQCCDESVHGEELCWYARCRLKVTSDPNNKDWVKLNLSRNHRTLSVEWDLGNPVST